MQNNDRKVIELNINDVLPNRFQPRIKFDDNSINELAVSIKKYGVIQPIVVRKIGEKYEIIAGERRYKASVRAGKQTIPAIISELNDKDSVEIALIENVQREDLTPIEKAISYKKILDMGYINQEDLAQKVGKSQSSIANTLRLLNLTEEVQEALLEHKISERHARSLLKLKNIGQQVDMLNKIIQERLTVRKTDEEIDKMLKEENNKIEEIVNIPDVAMTENLSQDLPGFMNIDKIETQATDIITEEKPLANIDSLLEPSTVGTVEVAPHEELLQPGKFFNFSETSDDNNLDIQTNDEKYDFNSFFTDFNFSSPESSSVQSVELETPELNFETMPEVQPMESQVEAMPTFDFGTMPEVQPMEPQVEAMPTFDFGTMPEAQVDTSYDTKDETAFNFQPTEIETMTEQSFNNEPLVSDSEIPMVEFETTAMPETNIGNTIKVAAPNLKLALNTIRECENTIEKYGFTVDVEEIDFEDSYQVTFKIMK